MNGAALSLTEATTGQLQIASNAYPSSTVDQLLTGKQASLVISGASAGGISLLNSTILTRVAFPDFSTSDSGHVVTVSYNLVSALFTLGTCALLLDVDTGLQITVSL